MIAVKTAIENGSWYHCCGKYGSPEFRIRIISFKKQNLSRNELKQFFDEGGNLWLMEIEVVSLEKERDLTTNDINDNIYLEDQDGFQFRYLHSPGFDSQIISDDKWENRLFRFSVLATNFKAKTKASGNIAFFLPEDVESEYYFGVHGTISEV